MPVGASGSSDIYRSTSCMSTNLILIKMPKIAIALPRKRNRSCRFEYDENSFIMIPPASRLPKITLDSYDGIVYSCE